jgi:hypothetical protein
VSFYTGTNAEVLFANGFAYPIANANSTSAQALITGASGKYQQPVLYGGFFQQGRSGQVAAVDFSIIMSTSGTPNATITAGLNTASNSIAGGTTLVAAGKFATSTWSSATVMGRIIISNFGSGYGTSSVSTNLWSSMTVNAQNANGTGVVACGGPTQDATVDFSVNQWLWLSVTFDAGSASNTATLQQLIVYGLN